MTLDSELLRRYAEEKSEDAFAELVRRHLDVVYSAALRQVNGNIPLAQDVAQTVFIDLSRKAAVLSHRNGLIGWLYTSTHFVAAKAKRTEQRRYTHEQEAHAMQESTTASSPDLPWGSLSPVLDQVMQELQEPDRDAILMRYFQGKSAQEIGQVLGISDEAAQKRVSRAIERLREFFAKRGIKTVTTALAVAISTNVVQAAPVGLANSITTAATLSGTALGATAVATKTVAMTTLQKTLIGATLAAGIAGGIYESQSVKGLQYAGTAPDPAVLLRGVKTAREQVPPSHLSLKTVFHSDVNHNDFGATVDFDGDRRQFIRSNTTPGRFEFIRAIYNGKDVLLYDNNQVSIRDISGTGPGSLYDPRLLGICGVLDWSTTILQCLPVDLSSQLETIGLEEITGVPSWHVRMTTPQGILVDWWIDAQHGFQVLRYNEKWRYGARSISSWYQNPDYQWLPSRVVVQEFGPSGSLVSRTETTVLEAKANIKIPKSTWTLKGLELQLPLSTRIIDTRSNTVLGYWDGKRIVSEAERNGPHAKRSPSIP